MPSIGGLEIPILDNVPRANWSIGWRKDTRYFTVHYNGPKVPSFGYPKGEKDQLRNDARWHMRAGAFGVKSGADGIQYHGATLSDGSNWLMRDIEAELWHCGNYEGNLYSISWHLPLGGAQVPTQAQISGLYAVIDAMRRRYSRIAITGVKGHKEWKATDCPGKAMPFVLDYREMHRIPSKPVQYFKTKYNANCRVAPDVSAPIALYGTAITPANTIFGVDAIVTGGTYANSNQWVHRADHIGFYHISVVQSVMYRNNQPVI